MSCSDSSSSGDTNGAGGHGNGGGGAGGATPPCDRKVQDGQLFVDVPTVTLSGSITVNGSVPTDTFGTVYLKNTAVGDSLILGQLGDANYTTKQIVPGVYDVYYGWKKEDTTTPPALPQNENARIQTGVVLTVSQMYNVDIPTVTLSGSITVNGSVPADTFGTVYLKNPATGDSLILGQLGDANDTTKQIIPGVYDVYYGWNKADTTMPPALPRNENVRLRTGVTLTSSQTFNVNIETVTLDGKITVDDSVPTDKFGTVYLKNPATGDSLILGQLGDANYTTKQIIPGVYDVYYGWNAGDVSMPTTEPRNENALVRSGVTLTKSQTFNVNIPTVTLSGSITVNDSVPAETFGTVYLKNTTTGDSLVLGQLGSATYTTKHIVPGTYDVYYAWDTSDTTMPPALPRNENVRLRAGVALMTSQMFHVNIPTVTLSGSITVDGKVPADTFGTVFLKDMATGDSLILGQLGDANYTTKQIVGGVYDVYYKWRTEDDRMPPSLPRNENARLQAGVTLTSSQTFNVDIPTVTLSGGINVSGSVPSAEFGTVYLKNIALGDTLVLGQTGAKTYMTKQILSGTYDIYYGWNQADDTKPPALPRNVHALLGCIEIVP